MVLYNRGNVVDNFGRGKMCKQLTHNCMQIQMSSVDSKRFKDLRYGYQEVHGSR